MCLLLSGYSSNAEAIRSGFLATYSASHVANFMLDKADQEGRPVTQMKLLKLVYIAYGWYLSLVNKKLFSEEIYAWKHGPVIRSAAPVKSGLAQAWPLF